jgi:hypothetical protein
VTPQEGGPGDPTRGSSSHAGTPQSRGSPMKIFRVFTAQSAQTVLRRQPGGHPGPERRPSLRPAAGTQGRPHREGPRAAVSQQGQHGTGQDSTAQDARVPGASSALAGASENGGRSCTPRLDTHHSLAFRVPCVLRVDHPARRQRYCSVTRTF